MAEENGRTKDRQKQKDLFACLYPCRARVIWGVCFFRIIQSHKFQWLHHSSILVQLRSRADHQQYVHWLRWKVRQRKHLCFSSRFLPSTVPASLYNVVSRVERNHGFLQAENGKQYLFWTFVNSSSSNVNQNTSSFESQAWTNLYFNDWSHMSESMQSCGYYYYDISQIIVTVPLDVNGQFNMSHLTISNDTLVNLSGCPQAR